MVNYETHRGIAFEKSQANITRESFSRISRKALDRNMLNIAKIVAVASIPVYQRSDRVRSQSKSSSYHSARISRHFLTKYVENAR